MFDLPDFFAGVRLLKELDKNVFNITTIVLAIDCMLACSIFAVDFSSIFYILIYGIVGVVVYLIKNINRKG